MYIYMCVCACMHTTPYQTIPYHTISLHCNTLHYTTLQRHYIIYITCIHAYRHTCIHAYSHAYMHTCIHAIHAIHPIHCNTTQIQYNTYIQKLQRSVLSTMSLVTPCHAHCHAPCHASVTPPCPLSHILSRTISRPL